MLNEAQRAALLEIARASVVARVNGRSYAPPRVPALDQRAGAFVTLHRDGTLRGCIGSLGDTEPLVDVVARCAAAAAISDPRFPPLDATAVGQVTLEISVLGPMEQVTDPTEIEVGRHGVVVKDGDRHGLLLPQVATEWGWDREELLAQTCVKAGLARHAWTGMGALVVHRFEAEVFGEVA
ncbi:MAG: AmmeMemoRadiSam system protein A [Vicinamibacterales bacterium]|jgi:AmmeMemoRadiSam system protein A|nr:AMMECR1 domain-containing protein [Acidobacteriota bacterium]MDP7295490.1 AmmeMemoRadiSam system protein A [Vicinamibacterales bacterium]MDP7471767.1 AmmeMemoRadiSam system protein A [Vicinamibacterales bacterium]MDP7671043.1 AmmeMemoRadiSam system protein A [Vicinamibacterales bacterium]HJO38713.1 AmmeMemoRadiSam system protein A [Vicinamibacterales bacterium]|tara:strand:- start:72 stop:614 length:543 start_codon:yes stop_codon:yes gene_type:complete